MVRVSRTCVIVTIILATAIQYTMAQGSTSASFNESYLDGSTSFEENVNPSPLPMTGIDGGMVYPGPTYDGSTRYLIESSYALDGTTLKTTVGTEVFTFTEDSQWNTIEAKGKAESSLVGFGVVQGVGGINSGFVEFEWLVTGLTNLSIPVANNASVTATGWTTLTSTLPGTGVLLNEFHVASGVETLSVPANSTPVTAVVPWQTGVQVPVFFDMTSELTVSATNDNVGNVGGDFQAILLADFGNSAELTATVLDPLHQPIPGAVLDITVVPEPSSFWCLACVASVAAGIRYFRRKH